MTHNATKGLILNGEAGHRRGLRQMGCVADAFSQFCYSESETMAANQTGGGDQ